MLLNLDKIRLNQNQIEALESSINNLCKEAYIFGSRTNLVKKGGDIDLLVLSKDEPYSLSKKIKRNYLKLIEEKIDVIVIDIDKITELQLSFLNSINRVKVYEQ
jgi:uncharacterized protein